ncbi:MAG: DUF2975 domain-containing protein [Sulfitobacter sp.]
MFSSLRPKDRLQTTATAGIWLSTAVLALLITVIGFFTWTSLTDGNELSRLLNDQLGLSGPAPLLNNMQAMVLTAVWLITDIIALFMLVQIRSLFLGIRRRGIFTDQTARRLRQIGWLLFAIGPINVIVNMGASMLLGFWRDPTALHGSISLDDGDFYAMVIGLVIVAVGHIMVDANRIETENRAIV